MSNSDRYNRQLQLYIERYSLSHPLLSAQVKDSEIMLLRQDHTGHIWCVEIDEFGEASTSGGSEFGWMSIGDRRVVYGVLPNSATQIQIISHHTDPVATHRANGVFLAVAPLAEDLKLTFYDDDGMLMGERAVLIKPARTRMPAARLRRWLRWRFAEVFAPRSTVSYERRTKRD